MSFFKIPKIQKLYNIRACVKIQIFYTCINAMASSSRQKICMCILDILTHSNEKRCFLQCIWTSNYHIFFLIFKICQIFIKLIIFEWMNEFERFRKDSKDFERIRKVVNYDMKLLFGKLKIVKKSQKHGFNFLQA